MNDGTEPGRVFSKRPRRAVEVAVGSAAIVLGADRQAYPIPFRLQQYFAVCDEIATTYRVETYRRRADIRKMATMTRAAPPYCSGVSQSPRIRAAKVMAVSGSRFIVIAMSRVPRRLKAAK